MVPITANRASRWPPSFVYNPSRGTWKGFCLSYPLGGSFCLKQFATHTTLLAGKCATIFLASAEALVGIWERKPVRVRNLATGQLLLLVSLFVLPFLLTGCGGTGVSDPSPNPTPGSPSVSAAPSSLNFGNVTVGTTSSLTMTVTNTGNADLVVSAVTLSGAGLSMSPLTFPVTITAGSNRTVTVSFAPQSAGAMNGRATITSNASATPTVVSIQGTGVSQSVPTLSVSPSAISYGNVVVGNSSSKNLTLTNPSAVDVSVSGVTVTGAGFSSTVQTPFTVSAGTSSLVPVLFQPQATGSVTGSVSVVSSASNSPGNASLSGTGTVQPVQHSVDVSWNASTSTVTGYNVYRGSQSGGPYSMLNSTLQSLTFTDSTVQSGTTYYYVVTAVDGNGIESVFSNEAPAVIPTP